MRYVLGSGSGASQSVSTPVQLSGVEEAVSVGVIGCADEDAPLRVVMAGVAICVVSSAGVSTSVVASACALVGVIAQVILTTCYYCYYCQAGRSKTK